MIRRDIQEWRGDPGLSLIGHGQRLTANDPHQRPERGARVSAPSAMIVVSPRQGGPDAHPQHHPAIVDCRQH